MLKWNLLGQELKALRKGARLTQEQLAEELGISQPYLSLLGLERMPIPNNLQLDIKVFFKLIDQKEIIEKALDGLEDVITLLAIVTRDCITSNTN